MDVRRLAIIALVLTAIGLVVPGFHHVRCGTSVRVETDGTTTREDLGCEETFPGELVPIVALLGLVGVMLATHAAFRLARSDNEWASRVVLALASLALLIPTVLPMVTWAYVGFDLALTDGSGCSGGTTKHIPIWIQHTTCLHWTDLVMTPLGAVGGALAGVAAWRPRLRLVASSLVACCISLAVFVVAFALHEAQIVLQWAAPLAGAILLAGALGLLTREPSVQHPA